MGVLNKLTDMFYTTEEDETEENVEMLPVSNYEAPVNVKSMTGVSANTKMVLFEPRSFEDCEEIAIHLKSKRATVVNLHKLNKDYAQRTIDFLTGVVFALDGTIKKIGHNVILCAPPAIGVAGDINGKEQEVVERNQE